MDKLDISSSENNSQATVNGSGLDQNLWNKLKAKKLVAQDNPPPLSEHSTWYIRVLLGFSGWISACFLFGFIGILLFDVIFDDGNGIAILIGTGCCIFAYVNFRTKSIKDFTAQLALAFNLCGQILISVGIWNVFDFEYSNPKHFFYLVLFVMQLLLVFIIPSFTSRVLSTVFSLAALFFCLQELGVASVFESLIFFIFILVWSKDLAWKNKKHLWEPIGYGLALTLLSFSGESIYSFLFGFISRGQTDSAFLTTYLPLFSTFFISLGFVYLLNAIRKDYQVALYSTQTLKLLIVAVFLAAISYLIQGASAGFALLIIGFLKQRRLLAITGILSLLSYISWYYYSLDWTLLYKSIVLIGLGALFAITLACMHFATRLNEINIQAMTQRYRFTKTNITILSFMVLILTLVNANIYQKEAILNDGKIVLLQLAPVDPRSLMQGDYMRLRFKIESMLVAKSESKKDASLPVTQGLFVVDLDDNFVGTFNTIYSQQALTSKQIKMQFRVRKNRIQLATHAFFFEEGTASLYEAAQYGEFRVAANGELLLNNLRDKDYKVIGYNRPNN